MAEVNLDIVVEDLGKIKVAILNGPVDSATHDQFKSTLDPLFMMPGSYVILECPNLTYINSKGLALLAKYHRSCFQEHGWMALVGMNRKIVKTMDLLGLGKVLKFYDTREAAIAAMTAG